MVHKEEEGGRRWGREPDCTKCSNKEMCENKGLQRRLGNGGREAESHVFQKLDRGFSKENVQHIIKTKERLCMTLFHYNLSIVFTTKMTLITLARAAFE